MRRAWEWFRNAARSTWHTMMQDEGYRARVKELHEFLTHPELGPFRRAYVGFFADKVHPDNVIHVDFKDERRFTEALKRRHGQSEEQIREALNSMEGLFFESSLERYTLYTHHIQALRHAEYIRMQLEKHEKGNNGA